MPRHGRASAARHAQLSPLAWWQRTAATIRAAEVLFTAARAIFVQTGDRWRQLVTEYHLGIAALGKGEHRASERLARRGHRRGAGPRRPFILPAWCQQAPCPDRLRSGDMSTRVAHCFAIAAVRYGIECKSHHNRRDSPDNGGHLAAILGDRGFAPGCSVARRPSPRTSIYALPEAGCYCADRRGRPRDDDLDDDAFQAAWEAGRRMSRADLQAEIDRLLQWPPILGPCQWPTVRISSQLTPREREVLAAARRPGAPTGRSRTPCSSATAPSRPTSPTSSPSSGSKPAPPPSPTHSSTTCLTCNPGNGTVEPVGRDTCVLPKWLAVETREDTRSSPTGTRVMREESTPRPGQAPGPLRPGLAITQPDLV